MFLFPPRRRLSAGSPSFALTFRAQLEGIGSLFLDDGTETPTSATSSVESRPVLGGSIQVQPNLDSFRIQRIVSAEFIWDNRIHAQVPRGPFKSSKDWILACLLLSETLCRDGLSRLESKSLLAPGQADRGAGLEDKRGDEHEGSEHRDKTNKLQSEEEEEKDKGDGDSEDKDNGDGDSDDEDEGDGDSDDEDDLEELEHTMDIISQLRRHLDDFFPPPGSEPEPTMILHDDLSRQNILVDDDGNLTAVVD